MGKLIDVSIIPDMLVKTLLKLQLCKQMRYIVNVKDRQSNMYFSWVWALIMFKEKNYPISPPSIYV